MKNFNIIFVCHGSICRSPAAEYILKFLDDRFNVKSRAISYEEIGHDIYPPMKKALKEANIPFECHHATYITNTDYDWADYIFYMDEENRYHLNRLFPNSDKVKPIYCFTPSIKEIEDPWYTSRYDLVIAELKVCIKDIISHLI